MLKYRLLKLKQAQEIKGNKVIKENTTPQVEEDVTQQEDIKLMKKNFHINLLTVHYNTPVLLEALVNSIEKQLLCDYTLYIFENSDKTPWDKGSHKNIEIIDNTDKLIIDFDKWLEKYPERTKSKEITGRYASARHAYTIEKCLGIIKDGFILMDSDILLKKDISDLWQPECLYVGEVGKWYNERERLFPFLCYINTKMMLEKDIHYFNDDIVGLAKAEDGFCDTGEYIYRCGKKYNTKNISLNDYIIHFGSGSWGNNVQNQEKWVKKNKIFWQKQVYLDSINHNKNNTPIKFINYQNQAIEPQKSKKCCVVIPIYNSQIDGYELASLKQCINILGLEHDIYAIIPENMNIENYKSGELKDKLNFIKINPLYFQGRDSYSLLCEELEFYKLFIAYEYMLIYQIDAWVFYDKLDEFCNMGYDYIGAPHTTSYKRTLHVGNGGLSLRKINKFIKACSEIDFTKYNTKNIIPEDVVFMSLNGKCFNTPPLKIAEKFSYQGTLKDSQKIPMGCHAFRKAGWSKWKDIIHLPTKICYTAIIGGYDKIRTPQVITPGWKYICFSDVPFKDPVWEYKPIPKDVLTSGLDNLKINRTLKILGEKYLPDHSINIYVDGNILIRVNLDDFIKDNCHDKELSIPEHYLRDCIYDEAKAVVKYKRESEEMANKVIKKYENEGFPHHYGLCENNVIIRKNTPEVKKIMLEWYKEYISGSRRDQLSLMYVLWKNNFPVNKLSRKTTRDNNAPFKHDGGTHKG